MPSIMFFVAKLFFFLSLGIQGALIIYLISKVCTQQSNWIGNAENLYVSQKNTKSRLFDFYFFNTNICKKL